MINMLLRQFFDAESATYTYLIADRDSGKAMLLDPVIGQLDRDLAIIKELDLTLVYAVDTHVHADHITALGSLQKKIQCKTIVSKHADLDCADIHLGEGDTITLGALSLDIIETPGHTPTCISLKTDSIVFTGDALLIRGCGRTDFQGGDAAKLYDSVQQKLFTLDDDTLVYPAHDYRGRQVTTIGEEKRFNPRFCLKRTAFIDMMGRLNLPLPKLINEALPANLACGNSNNKGHAA